VRFVVELVHHFVVGADGTDSGHQWRFAGKVPHSIYTASHCLFPMAGAK